MRAVILGCGQMGAELSGRLAAGGVECVVIDRDESAFLLLPEEFGGTTMAGNGLDAEVLRRAGVEKSEVFVAATANDNFNLMVAQLVKARFRVPKLLVRVYDPDKAALFADLDLETYCPTKETATAMERIILGEGR
jgi:trk system potassium uptake protein TrkA